MSLTDRTRSTARWALRTQRRIALVQVLFWPAVLGTGIAVGAVALVTWRRRRHETSPTAIATGTDTAAPAETPFAS